MTAPYDTMVIDAGTAARAASILAIAGSKVTVLQRGAQMLKGFEPELVGWLMERFQNLGIDVRTNTTVTRVRRVGDALRIGATFNGANCFGSESVQRYRVIPACRWRLMRLIASYATVALVERLLSRPLIILLVGLLVFLGLSLSPLRVSAMAAHMAVAAEMSGDPSHTDCETCIGHSGTATESCTASCAVPSVAIVPTLAFSAAPSAVTYVRGEELVLPDRSFAPDPHPPRSPLPV